jgi:hypothetical protein
VGGGKGKPAANANSGYDPTDAKWGGANAAKDRNKVTPISNDPNHPSNSNLKGTGTDGPAPQPKAKAEPDAPDTKTKLDDAPGDTPDPPPSVDTEKPGVMSAWKKVTEKGWGGLSPEEKGALIRGGVTAAMVSRAVTGHGAITGGEGLI